MLRSGPPTARAVALVVLLALAAGPAAAQVAGETHRTVPHPSAAVRDAMGRGELRVTVWYPAAEGVATRPLVVGPPGEPLFRVAEVAFDAPLVADPPGTRRPVILLSHGFGGSARIMGWFGAAMAREGYVVISVDHPGNNAMDEMTVPGAILWWERAGDLKRALEVVARDPLLGPRIDRDRVGAAGFSAGGFTALVLGGARADPQRFLRFCRANPGDGVCRPQVEFAVTEADRDRALRDPRVAALEARAGDDHSLPGVRAVFAMAPALVQAIVPGSLEAMRAPAWVVAGDSDDVAPPVTNAWPVAWLVAGARLELLPGVGHYAFLAACTEAAVASVPVCAGAGPQERAHRAAIGMARELFARHLGAPRE